MRNILHYGSFGGGYGVEQGKLMSTTDELFLGKQDSHSMWHGLYPLLTMIRHSCCPNSVISYVDESAMLRATLDLAAGDQVTINYMAPLSVPVKDRQQRLQNSQDFTCVCPRCTVEGKLPSSIQTKIQAIHALLRSEAQHQLWHSPAGNSKAKQGEDLARQSGTKARQHQGNAKTSVVDQDRHLLGTSLAQRRPGGIHVLQKVSLEDSITAGGGETDAVPVRLRQLAQEVSVLYSSTVPGYSRHIADMLRQAEFTNINFLGSTWDQEAILMAQDALQVRYGFTTDDQKQRSLQQALQNLPSICC
ncbi:hypothetical protein WJX82_006942 [Trebouxia sp. C0006]